MTFVKSKASMTAHAKINLCLNVLGRREDGYHNIESLMQPLHFGDDVIVERTENPGICLQTNHKELPTDAGNIAYRAAEKMIEALGLSCGFSITIHKRIPVAAGLAGGSTNAAAVLRLINEMAEAPLLEEELSAIGLSLGADVPFCLFDAPALAEGIGEKLTPVQGLTDCTVVLVNPGESVSTAAIYKAIDEHEKTEPANVPALLKALEQGDMKVAFAEMKNMMQKPAAMHCPAICELLDRLYQVGADYAMMSGSGATCFG
ncbi:MAG: 4-(cytidine 5'-diphospho)-2-C-methyl-D-erythritol kinase, partial [Clostridia bacterium]|nr:4-(cytidine 5'-diphospho)-2-C-methyl-D-erythritol kinase [Clostridia bacterium]